MSTASATCMKTLTPRFKGGCAFYCHVVHVLHICNNVKAILIRPSIAVMGCWASKPLQQSPDDQQAEPYHPVVFQRQTVTPATSNYVPKAESPPPSNNATAAPPHTSTRSDNPPIQALKQTTFARTEAELGAPEKSFKTVNTTTETEKSPWKTEEIRSGAVKNLNTVEAYIEEQYAISEAHESKPMTSTLVPTTSRAMIKPLASRYEDTVSVKPPVSKFRRARDERGMALILGAEIAREEREIRARFTDPEDARKAVDEFRRNYAASRAVRQQQQYTETRLRSDISQSPLAGPPSAEERRQRPTQDSSPFIGFDVLRWE